MADKLMNPEPKSKTKKTAQDIQDEIFKKMPAGQKIKIASELAKLCLKLSRLYENSNPCSYRNKIKRCHG